jgi:hypothetical protein
LAAGDGLALRGRLNTKLGKAIVLVTHDQRAARMPIVTALRRGEAAA